MKNSDTGNVKVAEKNKNHGDPWIWGIYFMLCFISVLEAYSASSQMIGSSGVFGPLIKHAGTLLAGGVVLFVVQHFSYEKIIPWIPVAIVLTIASMIYVLFKGDYVNGALRSFSVMGVSVQPSEIAKLVVVAAVSWIMSRYQMPGGVKTVGVVFSAIIVLVFGGLTYSQGFTNTAILMGISLAMLLIGGIQIKKFLLVLVFYMIAALCYFGYSHIKEKAESAEQPDSGIAVEQIMSSATVADEAVKKDNRVTVDRSGTRSKRLARFDWNEDSCLNHPLTSEYLQEQYAYMARAHGGIWGVLPGNSRECSRLPLSFSDYIYSIIVEELGLAGGIFVLVLYLALLARAVTIVFKCKRAFPALLIMGMAVMITVQALSHIAINCGAVPISGQPLPLISSGGSAIMVINIAFGIMISVSKFAVTSNSSGKTDAGKRKGSTSKVLEAENPTQI